MVKTRMQNGSYAVSEETRKKISEASKEYWARKKSEKLQVSANLTEFFISDPASD
jgi:Holliday junction resolvase-like predicted endonuclease